MFLSANEQRRRPGAATGFSIDEDGRFSESFTDFFDNPAWSAGAPSAKPSRCAARASAVMLPYSELEYGGFRDSVSALLTRFRLREERRSEAAG